MTKLSSVSLACFGKVASRGDFVRSTQHHSLTRLLDQWLSQGLERVAADPRWKQRYDQTGLCRFAFLGVRSRIALAGHMIPSVDSSGRRFPFVTAGSFELDAPLPFMSHAPMALSRLWSRLELIGREVCAAQDATASLGKAAQMRLEIDTDSNTHETRFDDFLQTQTVGSLEAMLRSAHPHLTLRRTLLAVGLLLQPVPASGVSRLDKGLALPLPDDPHCAPLVGAFWMSLVTPFLARADFELALFMLRRHPVGGPALCIDFTGGSPAMLQAIFDVDKRDEAFIEVVAADWADEHEGDDGAIKKLSSYLMQSQLSMGQAMRTFKECFLGR